MKLPTRFLLAILIGQMAPALAEAAPLDYTRQTIRVPTTPGAWRGWQMSALADVDNDGLDDLLAVGAVESKLWVYRQRATGFPLKPDQAIDLPAKTAWVALREVEPQSGLELVLSTAFGLDYLQQNGGIFESRPRPLVEARQVFTNDTLLRVLSLSRQDQETNAPLPVISASHAVLYHQNSATRWSPGPAQALTEKGTKWFSGRGDWLMGSSHSRSLSIRRSFLGASAEEADQKADERELKDILARNAVADSVNDLDINGDGRKDLVLWRGVGDLELKTDILVFLRDANNRFPQEPTQVLHCRGFPVYVGYSPQASAERRRISPVCALGTGGSSSLTGGDKRYALVLAALKTTVASTSGMVDMVLSGSLTWSLAIRPFKQGLFARSPETSIPLTSMVPLELSMQELFLIDGDFNGDSRPDLLVRRSPTQWDVVLSSDRDWFAPKPAVSFDVPLDGNFQIQDLNTDGQSDLVVQAWEEPTLYIFISRSGSSRRRLHRHLRPKPLKVRRAVPSGPSSVHQVGRAVPGAPSVSA